MIDGSMNAPEKEETTKIGENSIYSDTSPSLLDNLRDRYGKDNLF
jgi:hypothetical protein